MAGSLLVGLSFVFDGRQGSLGKQKGLAEELCLNSDSPETKAKVSFL